MDPKAGDPRPPSTGEALLTDMDQQRGKSAPGKAGMGLEPSAKEWISEQSECKPLSVSTTP